MKPLGEMAANDGITNPSPAHGKTGANMEKNLERIQVASIGLDKDRFLRQLLGYLAESLQEVTGMDQAEGFISLVGQKIGDELNAHYLQSLKLTKLDRHQIAAVLVDLKRRIDGDFYLIHADERQLVLGNRRCPFGDKVIGRPALCMMTSNVFGVIAAENAGYARVDIQRPLPMAMVTAMWWFPWMVTTWRRGGSIFAPGSDATFCGLPGIDRCAIHAGVCGAW